jgi:RNA polymerase sigma factor (TIGR02999 family)
MSARIRVLRLFAAHRLPPPMDLPEPFVVDLEAAAQGDQAARERVYAHSYQTLSELAKAALNRGWREKVSLSTIDVLHHAFVRLCGRGKVGLRGRAYFFGCFAKTCRDVLVDHWKKKRGAGPVSLVTEMLHDAPMAFDPVQLDDLLQRLSVHDPRGATVATMRIFACMDHAEVAEALDVSVRTVEADWAHARRWLQAQYA